MLLLKVQSSWLLCSVRRWNHDQQLFTAQRRPQIRQLAKLSGEAVQAAKLHLADFDPQQFGHWSTVRWHTQTGYEFCSQ